MAVQAFTDMFNATLDELATKLAAISGLQVVTDPRNLKPPCAFIDAPSFTGWTGQVCKMTFPVRVITLGPGNLDAQRSLLNMAALVTNANLGVTDGRPTIAIIGGVELPAYDLTIRIVAQK